MKIFFLTEGGANIGLGHITRCLSLYQAFEEKEIKPQFIINGDAAVKEIVENMDSVLFNWLEDVGRLYEIIKGADITFIDSYLAHFEVYKKISEMSKIGVYMDDNNRFDYPKGFVLNTTLYANRDIYSQKSDVTYLLGSGYTPLRKDFWEVPEKEIGERVKDIMLTFGGDDSKRVTPRVLKFLVENYPHLSKKVVIGRGFKNADEIEVAKDRKTKVVYYPDAEKMKDLLISSDIAISAGGQTLYEIARIGVPAIVIAVADNQVGNIRGWEKAGFIEFAGWWSDEKIWKKIQSSIKKLERKKLRLKRSLTARRFIDGRGSRRVRDILLGYKRG